MRGSKESDSNDVVSDVIVSLPEIMCIDQSLEINITSVIEDAITNLFNDEPTHRMRNENCWCLNVSPLPRAKRLRSHNGSNGV